MKFPRSTCHDGFNEIRTHGDESRVDLLLGAFAVHRTTPQGTPERALFEEKEVQAFVQWLEDSESEEDDDDDDDDDDDETDETSGDEE